MAVGPEGERVQAYKELIDSTLVVIIAMLFLGGYVALFDFILVNVVHFLHPIALIYGSNHSQRKINGMWCMCSPARRTRCTTTS